MSAITQRDDGILLKLRVVPRAARNEVCGILDDAFKIRLQAPPVEGKANRALLKFLARRLDLVVLKGDLIINPE